MKIVFLCGSLQPGRDGVGDYSRKLAAGLMASGNEAMIISLNDKFLPSAWVKEVQHDGLKEITAYRYSSGMQWNKKIRRIEALISSFKPDWLSLQYVSYSFDKKGLPFYLPGILSGLTANYKWHIMFHETWIGISAAAPFPHKVYGYFQRRIAASLIKLLNPVRVTTTNVLYQLILNEKNIDAVRLPLFSNIGRHQPNKEYISFIEKEYSVEMKGNSFYKLGVFGTLYPESNLSEVIPKFLENKEHDKRVAIIIFGKNSRPDELLKLKRSLKNKVSFVELGELTEENVSSVMNVLDEAVLCTPYEFIGKSGAYAALRLHNVPVVTLSSSPTNKYEDEINAYNKYLSQRPAEKWDVEHVSHKFLSLLNQ
ncbi:hypothetical protein [Parafilimonas sp.]|uniref:hypothetical protein n=1 Tax=Parafilimonas sp. TaxID=1969739 RepID=UPI003F7ED252